MRLAATVRCCLVSLTLLVGLLAVAPAPASTAAQRAPRPQPGCGTWVLQEVSSRAALKRQAPEIKSALRKSGVTGLSVRVPWSAIDRNFKVLKKARKIAKSQHKQLAVRFMAGRSTPARVFREGAYSYVANGERIPKPFSNSGKAGNPVFQRNFKAVVKKLAHWSERKGVRVLHLPWYGYRWAEIYNGSAVKAASGYSSSAWLRGHLKLVKIGHKFSNRKLTVEFALSGEWGGQERAAGHHRRPDHRPDQLVEQAGVGAGQRARPLEQPGHQPQDLPRQADGRRRRLRLGQHLPDPAQQRRGVRRGVPQQLLRPAGEPARDRGRNSSSATAADQPSSSTSRSRAANASGWPA